MAAGTSVTTSLQLGGASTVRHHRRPSAASTLRLSDPPNIRRSVLLLRGGGVCGRAAGAKKSNADVAVAVVCELEPYVSDSPAVRESIDTDEVVSPVGGDVGAGKNGTVEPAVGVRPGVDDGGGYGNSFGGNGNNGKFPPGDGGGGGDGGCNEEFDEEAAEFGPLLKFEEVMRETKARGVSLPSDMLQAAKSVGIRKVILENYFNLQGASWPLGYAIKSWSVLRNRMLVDRHFLFKVGAEVVIDYFCATFAEVKKRGKEFWSEIELYAADLLVGAAVNVALVSMLAPYARIKQPSTSKGLLGRLSRAIGVLPSSVFEAERPGCKFTIQQRVATYFYKGIMHGIAGFTCGIIGQGFANMIMTAKRNVKKSEEDIPVPPLLKSAALWAVFLGVSSNTRYQFINGLERAVEGSSVAKRLPLIAMGFTVGIRFSNNVYGGMEFVDWAKRTGCQ